MSRARLKDVAEAAGVSVSTVSLVLNDRHEGVRIPEDTRRRVRQAAEDLGYAPNTLARSLRTRRSHTIGFVSDQIATTPFAVSMLQAAQEAAWARGYLLFLIDTGGDPDMEQAAIESLLQQQVAGMVYACMFHRVVPVPAGLPPDTVFLDARPADGRFRAVVPDDRGGARAAVTELLRHGHRRIAFIDDEMTPVASGLRMSGYRDALAEHGIHFDPALHVSGYPSAGGGVAAGHLLDLPPERRPTALFCFNDRMAMGAYRAIRHRGMAIPGDVSVVGFDDQEYIASELDPGLTTVALPHREMGRWAIETLLDGRSRSAAPVPGGPVEPALMPCPLVRRESVGPPAG